MIISGIVRSSLIDFPKLVSCVLFTPGCNYDCYYCHNRHLIGDTEDFLFPADVMTFLENRKTLLDGVVISGGEPTLQPDLADFLLELRKMGYKVKLDSNGSQPQIIEELLAKGLCDYFAIDYKAPKSAYQALCGLQADAEKVLETICMLSQRDLDYEVRTTVAPELDLQALMTMARELPLVQRWVLNPYRLPPHYKEMDEERVHHQAPSSNQLKEMSLILQAHQPNILL